VNGTDTDGMACTTGSNTGGEAIGCKYAEGTSAAVEGGGKPKTTLSEVGRGLGRGYLQSLVNNTIDPAGLISEFAPKYSFDNIVMGPIASKTEAGSLLAYKGIEAVASTLTGVGAGKSIASAGAITTGFGMSLGRTTVKGMEFSHWIPKRMDGPRSLWNGNFVTPRFHALTDAYRFRFMNRAWKENNQMFPYLMQQAARVPYTIAGGTVGFSSGVAKMMED
jgi:hypothetical protein